MVVGLQGVSSVTGSLFGLPTTINVLPKTNAHYLFIFLIFSKINKVDLEFESISSMGFSNDLE